MSEEEKRPTAFNSLDPPRNFKLTMEDRVRALAADVPAYAERKRRIEDMEAAMLKKLVAKFRERVTKGATPEAARREIHALARNADFTRLNALIDKHNRYYPIEANLPIDPKTGGYLLFGRKWAPEAPWTPHRLVAAFDARILPIE